jgi:tyrosine-protein phosphatase SIW14
MRVLISAMAVTILLVCSCATPQAIPNFSKVDPGVYRGGQPTHEGWLKLQSLKVKSVIKLNTEQEGSDQEAESLGMVVHRYPVTFREQMFQEPNPDFVWDAASWMTPGTFVHCQHGQDRTGLVVGCYRIATGTPKFLAEREMLRLGFHKELRGLWEFWEDMVPATRD